MSRNKDKKAKEDNTMMAVAVNKNANKQALLADLRDSLIELNEKRKTGDSIHTNKESSWRDLFDDEDE